jgi:hypothetical protein
VHAVKAYGGVTEKPHSFLISAEVYVSVQIHASSVLTSGKGFRSSFNINSSGGFGERTPPVSAANRTRFSFVQPLEELLYRLRYSGSHIDKIEHKLVIKEPEG